MCFKKIYFYPLNSKQIVKSSSLHNAKNSNKINCATV